MKQFIDYDKNEKEVCINCYIEEDKMVVRLPILKKKKKRPQDVKVEKFNLANRTYLSHC